MIVEHLVLAYSATPLTDPRPYCAGVVRDKAGYTLLLRMQGRLRSVAIQRRVVGGDGVGPSWEFVRLAPTAWTIQPSVVVPGELHAFVTLTDCPDPPPWADA